MPAGDVTAAGAGEVDRRASRNRFSRDGPPPAQTEASGEGGRLGSSLTHDRQPAWFGTRWNCQALLVGRTRKYIRVFGPLRSRVINLVDPPRLAVFVFATAAIVKIRNQVLVEVVIRGGNELLPHLC